MVSALGLICYSFHTSVSITIYYSSLVTYPHELGLPLDDIFADVYDDTGISFTNKMYLMTWIKNHISLFSQMLLFIHALTHYNDVIMGGMASQITSLTIIYSIVYSDADQRKHQSSVHWPLCGEFTGDRLIPRTNGQLRGKCFHLMTSSCSMAA